MFSLEKIAKLVGGTLVGESVTVSTLSAPENQKEGTLCILNKATMKKLVSGAAAAYIVPLDFPDDYCSKPLIRTKDTRMALVAILKELQPEKPHVPHVSERAVIAPDAVIGKNVRIDDFVVVGAGSIIGDNTHLMTAVVVGENVVIGESCKIYPRVTLYDNCLIGNRVAIHAGAVLGTDGFGYIPGEVHTKIPHIGKVVIEDDVEIGANSTIDRAVLGVTLIKTGAKFDNLVQIGHNAVIGRGCLFASQSGVAGSSEVGDYTMLGGQVGVADHVKIGAQSMVAGKSGVSGSLPSGVYGGYPAVPMKDWAKQSAALGQLMELRRRVSELEKK